jgi:hypothetical protein
MFDVRQTIFDRHGESDEILIQKYIEGLMAEFARSSEAQPVENTYGEIGWAATMMHYAIDYMGCTPPEMTLPDFSEVLFELFPRKVSVEADQTGAIVAELQAFWRFMARQYGLDNARAIVASLDDRAATRLQDKLADPANFGMAKSFFMLGSEAGFDMTTTEGLAAFQAAYNARLLSDRLQEQQVGWHGEEPDLLGSPLPVERPSGDAIKKKRKEKKRQRDAKKRNRR